MNSKDRLKSSHGKASPKQLIESHGLHTSTEYPLAQDTPCMQGQLDSMSCLDCVVPINPVRQILHSGSLCFPFRIGIFPLWPFTSLLLLKSNKTVAFCLVTVYGITADGIFSMLPNARWHLLRAQKPLQNFFRMLSSRMPHQGVSKLS